MRRSGTVSAATLIGLVCGFLGHACFANARLSLFAIPDSSGLPNPINGIFAVLGLASRRSDFKEDTEGSTVMLCCRMSQEACA